MKDKIYYLKFLVLVFCLAFASCSDDDDKGQGNPVFPEVQKISCAVGETATLTFNANMNWKLSSSALWCKFVVDGGQGNSCSGEAGEQTITVSIGDDATALNKSYKAEIYLWMGGDKKVVYEITRPSTGYEVSLLDENGNPYTENNPATIAYKSSSFYIRANFDWQLTEWPDWIDADKTSGEAGEQSTNKLYINIQSGHTKNANDGFLTFMNQAGDKVATVPVKYEGIPSNAIEIIISSQWNWTFSSDGSTYSSSSGEEQEAPFTFNVIAKDDQYKVVCLINETEYTYSRVEDENIESNWFHVKKENETIELLVDNNDGIERGGAVIVFSMDVWNEVKNNFDDLVLPDGEVASKYDDYIITFKQSGIGGAEDGFTASSEYGGKLEIIDMKTVVEDPDILWGEYNTDQVYQISLEGMHLYGTVTVNMNGKFANAIVVPQNPYEGEGESVVVETEGSTIMIYQAYLMEPGGDAITIYLYSRSGETIGVLLVERPLE